MKTIWKFPLPLEDTPRVEMPVGAEILSIQRQHGSLWIWALVDSAQHQKCLKRFRIFGTGHPCDLESHLYITTVQDGEYVWHVFHDLISFSVETRPSTCECGTDDCYAQSA